MKNIELNNEFENFLYNIVYLRKTNNLSKKEMAGILGISIYSLNMLEKGIIPTRLGVEIIFKIQQHFSVSAKDLFEKKLSK